MNAHAQTSVAAHYEDEPSAEADTDNAAFYAGIARRRLYGITGEEAGDPASAYKLLLVAKAELQRALRSVEQAEERFAFAYGLGDGMMSPAEQAESERQRQLIRFQCEDNAPQRRAEFAADVLAILQGA